MTFLENLAFDIIRNYTQGTWDATLTRVTFGSVASEIPVAFSFEQDGADVVLRVPSGLEYRRQGDLSSMVVWWTLMLEAAQDSEVRWCFTQPLLTADEGQDTTLDRPSVFNIPRSWMDFKARVMTWPEGEMRRFTVLNEHGDRERPDLNRCTSPLESDEFAQVRVLHRGLHDEAFEAFFVRGVLETLRFC